MSGVLLLWIAVGALGVFVVWSLIEGWLVDPRRAREGLAAVVGALGGSVVRVDEFLSHAPVQVAGRALDVRAQYVGGQGQHAPRGDRGHLFVIATRLSSPKWEMHDVQVRQRRRGDGFDDRFALVESGVPVRDGWLDADVRSAIGRFYDHPWAAGTLRVDRGELQHLANWSVLKPLDQAQDMRDLAARFAAVADAFDRTAAPRGRMS